MIRVKELNQLYSGPKHRKEVCDGDTHDCYQCYLGLCLAYGSVHADHLAGLLVLTINQHHQQRGR